MQPVPCRSSTGDPQVRRRRRNDLENAINDEREQQRQCNEERKDREMKPERIESAAELVVDCEQCRDEWAIRLIAWERAESRCVAEEERNVPQFANGRVVYDCVSVVEMETVVKMVRVGREEDDRQRRAAQNSEELFSGHIRLRFKPI